MISTSAEHLSIQTCHQPKPKLLASEISLFLQYNSTATKYNYNILARLSNVSYTKSPSPEATTTPKRPVLRTQTPKGSINSLKPHAVKEKTQSNNPKTQNPKTQSPQYHPALTHPHPHPYISFHFSTQLHSSEWLTSNPSSHRPTLTQYIHIAG